jgi:NAD(P)H-flavin reductase
MTKTRLAHAEFTILPGSQTTLVSISALRSGWRPGQHVRIRVPSLGMRHGFEGHPFTIASAPDGEGMVLMCKVAGDWTKKLYDFAACPQTWPGEKQSTQTVSATIVLEGPYGGMGNTMLPSFSGVVLASGGSGISHSLALAHDVVLRAHTGVIRARTIDLIWAVPTQEAAKPLMPTLMELVEDAKVLEQKCLEGRKHQQNLPPPVALRVHIYVTRCPASSPILLLEPEEVPKQKPIVDPFASSYDDDRRGPRRGLQRQVSDAEEMKRAYLQRNRSLNLSLQSGRKGASYYTPLSGIEVLAKRPDFDVAINDVVDEVIDRAKRERNDASGVCVATCGPAGLVSAVRDATRRVGGKKRRAVGGIDYEEEHFGY